MNRKFACPYIIFYPVVSRDGMPFPINRGIREMQGPAFVEAQAWRGNIVVAKYRDNPFSSMLNASMADFPILKNYLLTHGCPGQVCLFCISYHIHVIHSQRSKCVSSYSPCARVFVSCWIYRLGYIIGFPISGYCSNILVHLYIFH